ncbi:MAG TPA: ABC transporter permease [Vicinamibacterales bacterium]|nr:ABC transporter permease [Vicinamibacterales bacterium]
MLSSFQHLLRYRALVQSLVARDLKARYRGSVLGFFWSFVNPLLLLLIYSFVFTVVMPGAKGPGLDPYALFMFCGILPWTWFSSSLIEASNVLIASGNLIRKVLFPAEILPIVNVLAGMVHFALGLPILAAFFVYYRVPVTALDLLWFPVIVLVQLLFTLGIALLVSALAVHFRDIRDLLANLLTLWFFATPIVYPLSAAPPRIRRLLELNPFTQLAVAYQQVLFVPGPFAGWPRLLALGGVSILVFVFGYFVFDRLRDTLAEEV